MFDLIFLIPLVFTAIILILYQLQLPEDSTRVLYTAAVQITVMIIIILNFRLDWKISISFDPIVIFIAIISGTMFFILDQAVLNIVNHGVLILDYSYYFCRKTRLKYFLISAMIAIGEEIIFRGLGLVTQVNTFIWVAVFSICFGIVHIFFSRYDVFSKIVLGLLLSVATILTNSFQFAIFMHIAYNFWASLKYERGEYNGKFNYR